MKPCISLMDEDTKELASKIQVIFNLTSDRLCGLVGRGLGYRSRGPEFDSRSYQIF
jgi:hypothetical protein